MNIEELIKDIALDIDNIGGRAYYVGGYVRDKFLNIDSKDIDIEVHWLEEQDLIDILSKYGKVKKVGASFGVYMIEGYDIDFSIPRNEVKIGEGHKDFDITLNPYMGTKKASKRRDFTINSIMQEILSGKIIDHYGGIKDLVAGRIKHVDDVTFLEDPLRVLRAAQFAARFNFQIDESTLELMKDMNIQSLSRERILEELKKALLKSKKPSLFFKSLDTIGHLDYWFKELKDLQGVLQNPKHHPEGDAYVHTLMVLDEAAMLRDKTSNEFHFMLSALCHDFGKKRATVITPEKITSYDHHLLGRDETREFLTRITNSSSLLAYVDNMVYYHMKPRMMYKDGSKINAYRRLTRDSFNVYDLMMLVQADTLGRTNPDREGTLEMINAIIEKLISVKDEILPVVHGRDLIALGYEPGPELGRVLKECYELQLDGFNKHTILTMYSLKLKER